MDGLCLFLFPRRITLSGSSMQGGNVYEGTCAGSLAFDFPAVDSAVITKVVLLQAPETIRYKKEQTVLSPHSTLNNN
jgi:hypothetical protein